MRKTLLSTIILSLSFCFTLFGQTVVSMNGKLKLVGNQLSSECGNPVYLRGMSSHGVQWFENCVNNNSFTSLKNDWKCDIVRIAMYVDEGGYKNNPSGWKTKIDNWVDQIGALGMYALIDWHILNPGNPNNSLTEAKEFWAYMSNKHKGKKHVIYEICNEPNGVAWSVVKTYAEAVIPVIRANDPETIIIVGTPQWSGKPGDVVSGGPLTGTNAYNTMYTFHFYAASHASYRAEVQKAAGSIPIFATEWGLSESSGGGNISIAEGQLWMDIFNGNNDGKQKISWCNWSFSDKGESSAALNSGACANSAWTNTTASGTQVKTWISSPAKSFTDCGATGNKNPIVSLTAPTNNSAVCAGTATTLSATASDPDGTISKVEFYNGNTLLGTTTTSPYTYTWTPTASGNASITAKAYDNAATAGTATSTAVSITVTASPNAPTGINPASFCENSTAPVWTATASTGNTLQWYTAATGGTASGNAPTISNTPVGIRSVYVSQKTINGGCEGPRLQLTTTVIARPNAPTAANPASFCENSTAPVWTATASTGNTLQWYTTATNGTASSTSPTITNTPSGTKNVWVSQKTSNGGCEGPRLQLTTTVIARPNAPTGTNPADFCENSTAPVWTATASTGNTLQWYTAATGGTASGNAPTISNTPVGIRSVYVSQKTINGGCESSRLALTTNVTSSTKITSQPTGLSICEGGAFDLAVTATGTGTLTYQWKQNGNNTGTNSRNITKASAVSTDAGNYTVDVKSTCGTVTSNVANVVVYTKPVITTQPTDKGGCVGSATSLSVVATGNPTPTFAWTPTGSGIGGTTSILSFASLAASDAGTYSVKVTNSCGTVTSNTARIAITLNESPNVILTSSKSQLCGDGASCVELTANPTGGGSAPQYTFKTGAITIGTTNQSSNTFTYCIPANSSTSIQNVSFTVDLKSNSICITPGVNNPVTSTPVTIKVDPQVSSVIANINETKATICLGTRVLTAATLPASYTATWSAAGGGASVSVGQVSGIGVGQSTLTTYKVESPLKICPSKTDTVTTKRATDPSTPIITNSVGACNTKRTGIDYSVANNVGATFDWSVTGGVVASGQGSNSILVDFNSGVTNATVSVIETNAQKCTSAKASMNVLIDVCTGIEEEMLNVNNVKIYPNPFESSFTVGVGSFFSQIEKIELCNLEGKVIEMKQGSEITSDIQLGDHVVAGQYFVRIVTATNVITKPIIKIK